MKKYVLLLDSGEVSAILIGLSRVAFENPNVAPFYNGLKNRIFDDVLKTTANQEIKK